MRASCDPGSRLYYWLTQKATQDTDVNSTGPYKGDIWSFVLYQDSLQTDSATSLLKSVVDQARNKSGDIIGNITHPFGRDGFQSGQPFAAINTILTGTNSPYIRLFLPAAYDESGTIVPKNVTMEQIDINSWNGSLGKTDSLFCKWILGYLGVIVVLANRLIAANILPDSDIVALDSRSQTNLFYLNSNRTIQSVDANLITLNDDVSALNLRLPYRRLAGTTRTDRGSPVGDDLFLYYQLNNTHLAEISRQGSYWALEPTVIYVPL
jgi:hypothetical protein